MNCASNYINNEPIHSLAPSATIDFFCTNRFSFIISEFEILLRTLFLSLRALEEVL